MVFFSGVNLLHGSVFHYPSAINHRNAVAKLRNHTQIMCDQNDRRIIFLFQIPHQFQNLRLNRHIERRRRLIRKKQFRLRHKRHGNHDPLFHAAGKLMWKFIFPRRRDSHKRQNIIHLPVLFLPWHLMKVQIQHFQYLIPHRMRRIQTGHGILKDHGNLFPSQPQHKTLRLFQKVVPVIDDGAFRDLADACRQKS